MANEFAKAALERAWAEQAKAQAAAAEAIALAKQAREEAEAAEAAGANGKSCYRTTTCASTRLMCPLAGAWVFPESIRAPQG